MRNPFRRRRPDQVEQRALTSVPWESGGSGPRQPTVTQDRALKLSYVYAAHRHIADRIATLPLKAYRRVGDERVPMSSLPPLLRFLEDEGTLVTWMTSCVMSLASQGNTIGLIVNRDGFDYPTDVRWRPRHEFWVDDDAPGRPQWYWNGRKIDRSELVHIPWLTVPGRTLALTPIQHAAAVVNAGLNAQEYGNDWFAAGGVPPGTFKNSEAEITEEQARAIKGRLVSAIRTREPIVYGRDWDFTAITIPPGDAQFVESQNLSGGQIASIYGLAPDEVGAPSANSLTYSTEETRGIRRSSDLSPWMIRIESALSAVLPERQYVRFNADAPIRADLKTRWEVYQIQRSLGAVSINEIRAREDLPALPAGQGGDTYTPAQPPAAQPPAARLTGETLPELTWAYPG